MGTFADSGTQIRKAGFFTVNEVLDIMPTFAEDRSVITIIVSSPTKVAISDGELSDILFEYARILQETDPEVPN